MRKAILIAAICLVVVLAASAAFATPNWSFTLQATCGGIANSGNCYIGANTASNDGKDQNDAFHPSMPDPNVQIYEMRNDWAGGSKLKSDFRATYNNGTKVFSNWFVWSNSTEGDVITVRFDPGEGDYAPPAGTYTCYNMNDGTSYDMMAADPAARTFDVAIGTYGSSGMGQVELRFVCTVGTGPAVYAAKSITTTALGTAAINCAPVLAADGGPFIFGSNSGKKIYKETAAVDSVTQLPSFTNANLTVPGTSDGNVVGRMASYGGYVYGVSDAGRVIKRNTNGSTTGNYAYNAGANYPGTPWVNADGTVLAACGNTIKKISTTGTLVGSASADLGAPVGAIACPGTDMVWAAAGNKLYCLNAALNTIRATDVQAGAGVFSQPAIKYGACVATYGNKLLKFNATSLKGDVIATAGGTITCNPYFAPDGKVMFAANDRKFYKVDAFKNSDITTFNLPATTGLAVAPDITGSAVDAGVTAIAGGADQTVYVIYPDGTVSFVGVNQSTLGCVMYDSDKVCFTSTDGDLYVIQ